jgi:ribonuclease HI
MPFQVTAYIQRFGAWSQEDRMQSAYDTTIHTDGAARGNPGPAAFAFVIRQHGRTPHEEAGLLGQTTNNIAEYTALVRALERAHAMGAKRLLVQSDSELLVKQMNGQYRVKNAQLFELYEQARGLYHHFEQVVIRHVPRSKNSEADRLCNEVLDGARAPGPAGGHSQTPVATNSEQSMPGSDQAHERLNRARAELIARLRDAAHTWASGGAEGLKPEKVWEDLEAILTLRKLLRRPTRISKGKVPCTDRVEGEDD